MIHNLNVGRRTDEILRVLSALQTGGLCAESWAPGQKTVESDRLKPGNIVSHYRVEGTLGEGGFGTVYVAHDTVLERKVAIKIVRNQGGWTPSVQHEARAAAALNHPNVCTVFGIDDSEGLVLIVMEYLTGQPFSTLIAAGPVPTSGTIDLARQIAAGMTAAYAAGIVHGDLKPANIFLTADGVVKILDFGVATRLHADVSNEGTASLCDDDCQSFLGTPAYMSPERADGGHASPAGDVFAFGLILYELLTGRRALDGANFLQVLRQTRVIDAAALGAAVVEPFRTLLPQMVARDEAERLTMREVAERLQHVAAGVV